MNNTTRSDVLIVVGAMAAFAIVGELGLMWLIHGKVETGSIAILSNLVSAAVGALASMLVSTSKSTPQPVSTATVAPDGTASATVSNDPPAPKVAAGDLPDGSTP